jgi:uncharacterized membrane protein
MKKINHPHGNLPVRYRLALFYFFSTSIVILMVVVSAGGIINRAAIYPTEELLRTFAANDVVNLFIGVPILLGSMWLAWRGKIFGLLCWPGALFFVFYNYLAYIFALPFDWRFPIHLILTVLGGYTLAGLMAAMDGDAIKQKLEGKVHEKLAGGILAGFGILFLLRSLGVMVGALAGGNTIAGADLAVNISDIAISPALIIGGILLWRRKAFGYSAGLGLLFQASMLFIALIAFFILQPMLTTETFKVVDTLVIFIMGLICFVPFFLFSKSAWKNHNKGE